MKVISIMFFLWSGFVYADSGNLPTIADKWNGYYICVNYDCNDYIVLKGRYFESEDCKAEISKIIYSSDSKLIFQIAFKNEDDCILTNGEIIKFKKITNKNEYRVILGIPGYPELNEEYLYEKREFKPQK